MSYPADLKYTREHEWIKIHDNGTATIGITEFAQGELGDIVFVELHDVGTEFSKDDVFGTVEAVKTVSELFAPVSGKVIEHNAALQDDPELVNKDCYGDGWMIKIELRNLSEVDGLLSAEEYQELI